MTRADSAPLPADLCACGHSRNHHSGYGRGRCLNHAGCPCPQLTTPTAATTPAGP